MKKPSPPKTKPAAVPLDSEEDLNDQRHHITMTLECSLRLLQAVAEEKRRRKAAGIPGRVTESTIIRRLIEENLPPVRT